MPQYIISLRIEADRENSESLPEVIAFSEGENYHLVGLEQISPQLKALLPNIENNLYEEIALSLQIREGNETEAEIFTRYLEEKRELEQEGANE